MISSSSLVPGRIYTFVYAANVEMVAKKRDGRINPLADCQVSVRRVCRVQAAGDKTYQRAMLKKNSDWKPSGKPSWNVGTENACIRVHKDDSSRRYLRGIPLAIDKEEYFIGTVPATAEETVVIKTFSGSNKEPDYILFNLDNIANLIDNGGEQE
jgi:hypothetical protein